MKDRPATVTAARLGEAAGELLTRLEGPDVDITGIAFDSRVTRPGDLFFCISGAQSDGHDFAAQAVAAGASALCVERLLEPSTPQIVVTDARRALGRMAAAFYGYPARDLMIIGVTGTNGKTTTTWLLDSILIAAGRKTGLIGTIEARILDRKSAGVRTTPESADLQALFAQMRSAGVDAVAMEVTSHGLALHRLESVELEVAAFTNLTQDHLDFHQDMEDYYATKAGLFGSGAARLGVANLDDPYGERLLADASIPMWSYGFKASADVVGTVAKTGAGHTSMALLPGPHTGAGIRWNASLVGGFNAYNCFAAATAALRAGVDPSAIVAGLEAVRSVPGRFESVDAGQPFAVLVDYAHTPDSLTSVLTSARALAVELGGRLIAAFGCGGDRDRAKRPLMGAAAARLADVVIVTSDNPRSEDPDAIIAEILPGVGAIRPDGPDLVEADRRIAIGQAIGGAEPGDVVVIAGKGHETGQQFADHKIDFDDRIVAREALTTLGWSK